MKLTEGYYLNNNVVAVAGDLLGKVLFTRTKGVVTAGRIVETEAYSYREKGCHAYNGQTPRNKMLYAPGGTSYVYLCYGIHNLFNVVTNDADVAEAVLIRALEPVDGMKSMLKRMNATTLNRITAGPGKLTKAMGIDRNFNGKLLWDDEIWIEEGDAIPRTKIVKSARIGIDYAGKDALLPWRFTIRENPWVSKP